MYRFTGYLTGYLTGYSLRKGVLLSTSRPVLGDYRSYSLQAIAYVRSLQLSYGLDFSCGCRIEPRELLTGFHVFLRPLYLLAFARSYQLGSGVHLYCSADIRYMVEQANGSATR